MAEQRRALDPTDEQHTPGQSPIEEEFAASRADGTTPRDRIMVFGYSLGIILVAVFVLFLIAVAVVLLVS